MSGPAVSVVIPTYNHQEFVRETLGSVFAQTFDDYEVIVVNDGSLDHTAALLRPLAQTGRIRYFEQENAGPPVARNRGLAECRGEFIAFLDDDDLWPADKLQWQVGFLRAHTAAVGVGGQWADNAHRKGLAGTVVPFARIEARSLFFGNPFVSPGQVLLRGDVLRRIGGFDASIWGADDFDLWFRLAKQGPLYLGGPVSLVYRWHDGNASRDAIRMFFNTMTVLERHLGGHGLRENLRCRRDAYRFLKQYKGAELHAAVKSLFTSGHCLRVCALLWQTRRYWASVAIDTERVRRFVGRRGVVRPTRETGPDDRATGPRASVGR